MWKVLGNWVHRYLGDEEAVLLAALMTAVLVAIVGFADVMGPLLAALVLAFLLQGIVARLERLRVPHILAVWIAFLGFLGLLFSSAVLLFPILAQQSTNLLTELPAMVRHGQAAVLQLPERYPHLISQTQLEQLIQYVTHEATGFAEVALSFSMSRFADLVGLLVYLVLVPLMVFFMLKDSNELIKQLTGLLPRNRPVMNQVWQEMDVQMANYVRGKVIQILIVAVVSYIAFAWLGLRYGALLALVVGLSVLVPYIGAVVATVPVLLVGYVQLGWGSDFFLLMAAYGIIQFLDGNVLVPLLFSDAVNLHPVAIILAVLLFGGLWGLWGLFFAIPLATLIKALHNAWPRNEVEPDGSEASEAPLANPAAGTTPAEGP
ncbi:MAG: AI-2E family transporter [Gammaproteobacteria bacterium]